MKVAIIGAGAVGLGGAALLRQRGHEPLLWSPSLAREAGGTRAHVEAEGAITGAQEVEIAPSCGAAVQKADVVFVAVPGFAHQELMDAFCPLLAPGKPVIISSHCSLSGLYLAERRAAAGRPGPVVALGTTVTTGRRRGPLSVRVGDVRARVDLTALPAAATTGALDLCVELFGERFATRDGLVAISLTNINPQNHMAMALCNLTRIENGEAWGNFDGITGAVGRLIEALDRERLALAAAFGVTVRTVREHFEKSFDLPPASVAEMSAVLACRPGAPMGPVSLDTRYVLEDVPYGLVPTERLAAIAGVAVPLHSAGIELFCGLYGRDFRSENTLLKDLGLTDPGLSGLTVAALNDRLDKAGR